jgi:Trypsin
MESLDNDIAIIELQSEVTFSPTVAPICVWPGAGEQEAIEGLKGTVILVKICTKYFHRLYQLSYLVDIVVC